MFCTNCGANLPDGTVFCTSCGAPMNASAEPVATAYAPETTASAPQTKEATKIDVNAVKDQLSDTLKPVKKFFSKKSARFGVIGGIALVLAICIVCAILFSGNGYVAVKQEVVLLEEEGTLSIVVNGKVLKDSIDLPEQKDDDGKPIKDENGDQAYYSYTSTSSMDGKITAIFVYDYITERDDNGWYVDSYREGDLYVLKGKKLMTVAEDVYDYQISVSGKGITYLTRNKKDEDAKFDTYTLSLYTVGNKKTTTVNDEALGLGDMSPDGKSVAYFVGEYNEKDNEVERTLMLHSGKKSTEISDKDLTLVGLSNGGKYIYTVEREEKDGKSEYTLYCFNNKGKSSKLGEADDMGALNKDHTQILFYEDGDTYIANKNKAAEKVAKKELELIAPDSAASFENTAPVSDFYGKVYITDAETGYDAYMIKKGGKDNKLVDGGYQFTMDESGEYLYYTNKKDDLKCVQISMNKNAKSKAVTIAEDVMDYEVTSNRKLVYFINDDDELLSVNGKKGGKTTEVCDEDVATIAMSKKNVLFYLVKEDGDSEGEVFATKNGKAGKSIQDDVKYLNATNFIVVAKTEDDYYVSTGSNKLTKLELN